MFICAEHSALVGKVASSKSRNASNEVTETFKSSGQTEKEACTPIPLVTSKKEASVTDSKKHQTAKKIASLVRNPSALKSKGRLQSSQVKNVKPSSAKRWVHFLFPVFYLEVAYAKY